MLVSRTSVACLIAVTTASLGNWCHAQDNSPVSVIKPYVNNDTFVAAYCDLSSLPKPEEDANFAAFAVMMSNSDAGAMLFMMQAVDKVARTIAAAGVDSLYMVAGLADLSRQGGPIAICKVRPGVTAKDVETTLKSGVKALGDWGSHVDVRAQGDRVVLIGRPSTVNRYVAFAESERSDLLEPFEQLIRQKTQLAAVLCPGPDFRRVVRELWPEMPGPLAPLRGELADRWQHLEFSLPAGPDSVPQITLQAADAEAAEIFAKLWGGLPTAVAALDGDRESHKPAQERIQVLIDALPAKVDGTRASLVFPTDEKDLASLRKLVGQVADSSMQSTYMQRRLTQFKNIAVAMLNYENSSKTLPPAAIRDNEGRALLSWRVAILPFLGQGELYKQFHLEESWDSAHNVKLLEKMPSVYADPDPELRAQIGSGKTTYVVPVGPETIFYKHEGTAFHEVTDGTVKTLLLVEVEPSRAVAWTKPADWEVNMQEPLDGVRRSDRRRFVVAFAFSDVETVPVDVEPAKLRGLLTRSGREVFDWP